MSNVSPAHRPGVAKYNGYRCKTGIFSAKSFPGISSLPSSMLEALVSAANNGLATKTQKQYQAVRKHLTKCQEATKMRMSLPMGENQTLALISYLFGKNLKSSTVANILSGIRAIHLAEGCPVPVLRTSLTNMVLRGRENWDEETARGLPKRLPVTIDVMRLLRRKLQRDTTFTPLHKALVWSVATLCFWGGLRIGEALSKTARTVDPLNTLLKKDLVILNKKMDGKNVKIIKILLKSTKESRYT